MLEYALIISLVAAVVIVSLALIGPRRGASRCVSVRRGRHA